MLKNLGINFCLLSLLVLPLASQAEEIKDHSANIKTADDSCCLKTPEPKTALEHNNRGVELGMKGLWEKSIKEHNIALLEDPTDKFFRTNLSSAHMQYGNILLKKGNILEAMVQFHAALYVDPNNKEAEEKLKNLDNPKLSPVKPSVKIPVPGELDEFLKGKANTLHGYDTF
jgi:tetratricopeptide (TPR) repeat protein